MALTWARAVRRAGRRASGRVTHRGADTASAWRTAARLSPADLDGFVRDGADLESLLGDVGVPVLGDADQRRLLEVLTVDRLADLSVPARARIVAALQTGITTAVAEDGLARVFEATTGADLRELRNLCDGDGTHQDLAKLVFEDIDDDAVRQRILTHIAEHAGRDGAGGQGGGGLKILSDVDDTFLANLKDRLYPHGTIYPGAVTFYTSLDEGPASAPNPLGDITFVTARPSDPLGLIESGTHRLVRSRGIGSATVLSGSLATLFGHRSMAAKKLENVRRYAALFPDYAFVFLGDNGQGDVDFAEQMMAAFGDVVRAVYIHAVLPVDAAERKRMAARGVVVVDTHVAAAGHARGLGLISAGQLRDVVEDARAAFERVRFRSAEARRTARAQLEADITSALPPAGRGQGSGAQVAGPFEPAG